MRVVLCIIAGFALASAVVSDSSSGADAPLSCKDAIAEAVACVASSSDMPVGFNSERIPYLMPESLRCCSMVADAKAACSPGSLAPTRWGVLQAASAMADMQTQFRGGFLAADDVIFAMLDACPSSTQQTCEAGAVDLLGCVRESSNPEFCCQYVGRYREMCAGYHVPTVAGDDDSSDSGSASSLPDAPRHLQSGAVQFLDVVDSPTLREYAPRPASNERQSLESILAPPAQEGVCTYTDSLSACTAAQSQLAACVRNSLSRADGYFAGLAQPCCKWAALVNDNCPTSMDASTLGALASTPDMLDAFGDMVDGVMSFVQRGAVFLEGMQQECQATFTSAQRLDHACKAAIIELGSCGSRRDRVASMCCLMVPETLEACGGSVVTVLEAFPRLGYIADNAEVEVAAGVITEAATRFLRECPHRSLDACSDAVRDAAKCVQEEVDAAQPLLISSRFGNCCGQVQRMRQTCINHELFDEPEDSSRPYVPYPAHLLTSELSNVVWANYVSKDKTGAEPFCTLNDMGDDVCAAARQRAVDSMADSYTASCQWVQIAMSTCNNEVPNSLAIRAAIKAASLPGSPSDLTIEYVKDEFSFCVAEEASRDDSSSDDGGYLSPDCQVMMYAIVACDSDTAIPFPHPDNYWSDDRPWWPDHSCCPIVQQTFKECGEQFSNMLSHFPSNADATARKRVLALLDSCPFTTKAACFDAAVDAYQCAARMARPCGDKVITMNQQCKGYELVFDGDTTDAHPSTVVPLPASWRTDSDIRALSKYYAGQEACVAARQQSAFCVANLMASKRSFVLADVKQQCCRWVSLSMDLCANEKPSPEWYMFAVDNLGLNVKELVSTLYDTCASGDDDNDDRRQCSAPLRQRFMYAGRTVGPCSEVLAAGEAMSDKFALDYQGAPFCYVTIPGTRPLTACVDGAFSVGRP